MSESNLALELRDNAKHQIQQIKDIETGTDYLNKVKTIETWAKAEKMDAELQNTIAEWLECYQEIGQANGYSEQEIQEYFGYIQICRQLQEQVDNQTEKQPT